MSLKECNQVEGLAISFPPLFNFRPSKFTQMTRYVPFAYVSYLNQPELC